MKIFISTSHSLDAERHLWHSHAERGNEYDWERASMRNLDGYATILKIPFNETFTAAVSVLRYGLH